MKKILAIFSIFALLLVNVPYTHEKEGEIPVVVNSHGVKSVIKMNEKNVNELTEKLTELTDNIKNGDMKNAKNIAYGLEKYGLNLMQYLDENRSNIACLVVAIGYGVLLFTPGVILYSMAQHGILFPLIVYIIIFYATHIIPFRILNPVSYIGLTTGRITAVGMEGTWSVEARENGTTADATVLGFSGITISTPKGLTFILGFAIYAKEGWMFKLH